MIGQWKSGGDGANTTKALMAEMFHSWWLFTGGIVHFLTSLNAGGNICSVLCLFFNELELCAKTARSDGLVLIFTIDSFVLPKIVLYFQLLHQTS